MRQNNYWDWWEDLDRLQREVSGLFGRASTQRLRAFPPVNVTANAEGAMVYTELPGVDPEKVDLSVLGDTLTIKGERSHPKTAEGSTLHMRERFTGPFNRSVQLPFRIEAEGVVANFRNGVLEVFLPKAQSEKARSIPVSAGA